MENEDDMDEMTDELDETDFPADKLSEDDFIEIPSNELKKKLKKRGFFE